VNEDFPSLDQFDHMIVAVGSERGIEFIDPTSEYAAPLSSVDWYLAGRSVLVLAKKGSRLVEVPFPKTTELDMTTNQNISFESKGNIRVTESVELRNRLAVSFRGMFASTQASSEKSVVQGLLAEVEPDIQVQSVRVQDLEDRSKPLKIELDYSLPSVLRTSGSTTTGRLPSLWGRYLFTMEYLSTRHNPFEWRYPLKFRSISKIAETSDRNLRFEPQTQSSGKDFVQWRIRKDEKDKSLFVTVEVLRKAGQYESNRYSDCFDAMMDFSRAANSEFSIAPK
jgi:hypothetical protein